MLLFWGLSAFSQEAARHLNLTRPELDQWRSQKHISQASKPAYVNQIKSGWVMIYRGCCDRFMCFRQPSERWRHVHQGYWALSSFTLEEETEAHFQCLPYRTGPYNLHSFFEVVCGEFVLYFSSSPSLVERSWWTEGAPLTAVRLASVGSFPQSLSSSGEWSIRSSQLWLPSQWENQISANYHYGLLYSGRTLINSPSGLETMKDWCLQRESAAEKITMV